MSESVGKVQLDLETNYAPFQQQLNNISGKSTNMVTAAFGKIAKVAGAAFAVGKLVSFGKASIALASDLQEVQNVVDVVFGQSASQIDSFAKSAITSYGLSELSAKRYSSTMGAMLKSMGLSGDAVLNMSQSITALTGDMASFYNLDSETAFQKIRAGISGETEPLKQLGINMSQANLEAFALSQGITKSMQSMTQSEQALLRYNYLLSVTSDAQGDFARTSDSWANQTRILTEQLNSLKATLGSAFLAMLTPVVRLLNTFIAKLQTAAAYFKAFVEALTGTKAESESTASGLGAITEGAEETAEAATKAKTALAGFDKLNVLSSDSGDSSSSEGNALFDIPEFSGASTIIPEPDTSGVEKAVSNIKGMFDGLKSYIQKSFAPAIKGWGDAFSGLKAPLKSAAEDVKKSMSSLWKDTLAPFGSYLIDEWIPDLVNAYSNVWAPIYSDVLPAVVEGFAKDFEFWCVYIDNCVNDILTPAFDTVKTISTEAANTVADEWEKSGTKLIDMFGKVRDSFKEIWTKIYDSILKPIWTNIIDAIDSLWSKHLKGLWESIVAFVSKLGECVMTIWNNFLAPIVSWLIDVVGPIIAERINNLVNNVKNIIATISDVCKGIFDALGGLLDFITGVFSGDWKKAWQGLGDFFEGIWDAIWAVVKFVLNLIIDGLNKLWTAIYDVCKGIVNGVGKLAEAIGDLLGQDWGFSMPSKPPLIPKLARGGIIDQPTLAMVGEAGKEAVVPLENTAFADSIANAIMRVLMPLFASGKGVGKSNDENATVVVLKVGEYELGRVTVGAINKYHNVIGKVELEV